MSAAKKFFSRLLQSNAGNVQISEQGRAILNDKSLASQLIDKIMVESKKLEEGKDITVNAGESSYTIRSIPKESAE